MLQNENGFLQVWQRIWEFQNDEDEQSLSDSEIKKKIYLEASTTFITVFGTLGVFIILINLPVVISSGLILKKNQGMRSTYWLLGNISLADMITGFVLLSSKIAAMVFPGSETAAIQCDIYLNVGVASMTASLYSVAFIAIDRYLYIVHGLKYNQWVTATRLRIVMIITWIYGILLGAQPLILWTRSPKAAGRVCLLITTVKPTFLTMLTASASIPMTIACVFHGMILYNAIRNVIKLKAAKNLSHGASDELRISRGSEGNSPSKLKAIKVVFFTTGAMMMTIMPFLVVSGMYVICDPIADKERCKRLKYIAGMPLYMLVFGNSFLNPIIYAWWHKGFRSSIKKIYETKVKRKRLNRQLETAIGRDRTTSTQTLQSQTSSTTNSSITTVELN